MFDFTETPGFKAEPSNSINVIPVPGKHNYPAIQTFRFCDTFIVIHYMK